MRVGMRVRMRVRMRVGMRVGMRARMRVRMRVSMRVSMRVGMTVSMRVSMRVGMRVGMRARASMHPNPYSFAAHGLLRACPPQVLVLLLQRRLGSRFFASLVPAFLLPKPYDYFRSVGAEITLQVCRGVLACRVGRVGTLTTRLHGLRYRQFSSITHTACRSLRGRRVGGRTEASIAPCA